MNVLPSSFDPGRLANALNQMPPRRHYVVGLSGGADSTALLLALSKIAHEIQVRVSALHFNHGLNRQSGQWALHCARLCDHMDVELHIKELEVSRNSGQGLEAEARRMRYEFATELLGEEDAFVTAHHLEDQAETLLLNLMRSSGVDGLAGIPPCRPLGRGYVLRPLLDVRMSELRTYLENEGVSWIDDPSNEDLGFDRNYIRHEVLPRLESRWPAAALRIAGSADHCRQAAQLLENELDARVDLQGERGPVISLNMLQPESDHFMLMLRSWLKSQSAAPLPRAKAMEFKRQVIESAAGRCPTVQWDQYSLSLFDGKLWLSNVERPPPCPTAAWRSPGPLHIDKDIGEIEFINATRLPPGVLTITARRNGDRIRSRSGRGHRTVKDMLREAGFPPWLRNSVPMLRRGSELLAVAGIGISPELDRWLRDHDTRLEWRPQHPVLKAACAPRAVDRAGGLR